MSGENPVIKTIEGWVATLGRLLGPFWARFAQFLTFVDNLIDWFLGLFGPRPDNLSVNDIGMPMNSLSKEEAEERGLILHENRWVTPDERTIQARVRAMTPQIMILGLVCVALSAVWACSIVTLERSPLTPFLNPKLLEALVPFIAGVGLLRCRNWAWSLFMVVLVYILLVRLETLVWSSFLDDTRQKLMAACRLLGYVGYPAVIVFNSTALRVFNVSKKRLLVSIVVALIVAPLGFVALYDTGSELIDACRRGNIKKAEFQLNRGANVNARGYGEDTPLRKAAYWDHPEIVRMLLRHGADPNERDSDGATALSDALALDQIETVNALLGGGADPNAMDNDGWTPLNKAVAKGNPALVRALLENGAEINARNKTGGTALMVAVYLDKVEAARLLLQEGADLHAREQYGCTALELALSEENEEMVKLLREYGAKE